MTPKLLLAAALLCGLTACQTCPVPVPKIITKTVNIPVPVPCQPILPPPPAYVDTPEALRATTDLYDRVKLLLLGRAQRQARETVLNTALTQCAAPIAPPVPEPVPAPAATDAH